MKGVAARYPSYDAARGKLLDLEARINLSRTEHQKAAALPFESKALLALTAYVGRQSRGMPIAITDDAPTPARDRSGPKLFEQRQGQLNLSCAQCHDDTGARNLAPRRSRRRTRNGLSALSAGMAEPRLAAAAPAQSASAACAPSPTPTARPSWSSLKLYLMRRARAAGRDAGGAAVAGKSRLSTQSANKRSGRKTG